MKFIAVLNFFFMTTMLLHTGCIPDRSMGPDELIERGKDWYSNGDYDRAIADYTQALSISQEKSTVYMLRGIAYYDSGEFELALSDFTNSIKYGPENAEAHYMRGNVWSRKAKIEKAIDDYNKSIELNPDDALYYFSRGTELEELNRINLALLDYNKAIEIDEDFDGAYFFRAMLLEKKGQLGNAISDYNNAISLYPNDASYHFKRGFARAKLKDYSGAISDYRKSIQVDPKYTNSYNNLAWLLSTCPDQIYRDGAEAVNLAEKAVKLKRDANSLDTLAAAQAEAGRFGDAIHTQNIAIEILKKRDEQKVLFEAEERLENYKIKKPWREQK